MTGGGKNKNQRSQGFTIVELLIVIVIILILVTLVIVTYSGIQARARNLERITAAKDWQKLIQTYLNLNGKHPPGLSGSHICLGTGYPTDWDSNPNEDCFYTGNIKHPSATTNAAYQTVTSRLPGYPAYTVQVGSFLHAGISVRSVNVFDPAGENIPNYPMMWYVMEGINQDCVLRPVLASVSGGFAETTALSSDGTYGDGTLCIIKLPDPNTI